MCEPLPYRNFTWLSKEEVKNFDVVQKPDDGELGYILEVNLQYPEHLHYSNVHDQYPLAPEKILVESDDLSPYSRMVAHNLGINPISKIKKFSFP